MDLWLVVETAGGERRELAVTIEAKQSVNDLSAAIADRLGRPAAVAEQRCLFNHRLGTAHEGADTVEASGVRFGDHLTLAPHGWRPLDTQQPRTGGAILHLAVIGGPGTGRRVALGAGDHVVGRSPDADVVVDDPALSRRHFRVIVRNDGVTVTDDGSSNGTFIAGQSTEQPVELGIGSVIEAGHSLFRVESYEPSVSTAATGPDGFVRFNRPPRYHPRPVERRFRLPAPPVTPERRRIPMASALGPLLVGVPMIIVALTLNSGTGRRMLVAISVVTIVTAPVLAFVSYWDDRRGGAKRFRRDRERFDTQLAQVKEQLSASITEEEHERRRASPDAADLVERAVRLRSNLWERRPDDPDFLRVSVGWADQSAESRVDVAEGGDDQARADVVATLDDLSWDRSAGSDARVPLGLVDVPRAQRQDTFVLDLEADGSALVIGTTGSGKTTLLRTIAVALARDHRADAVHIQCIDAAGRGLAPLESLPHVGSVVPGDDIERIQRTGSSLATSSMGS